MNNRWKFVNQEDLFYEKVSGREHYWHYHPDTIAKAGSYMVKVVIREGDGHDFHVHPEMHEILYVTQGQAEQWIEDEVRVLEVGDSVYIEAGVVHATFNGGKGDLEFLAFLSPTSGWDAGTVDRSQEKPYSEYRK